MLDRTVSWVLLSRVALVEKKPQNNNNIPEESENSSLLFILITVDRFIEYLKLEGSHKDD